MKREKNRITLTLKEADAIREHLETLYAMKGAFDEEFTAECHSAGKYARKMCELLYGHRHPQWGTPEPPEPKYDPTI